MEERKLATVDLLSSILFFTLNLTLFLPSLTIQTFLVVSWKAAMRNEKALPHCLLIPSLFFHIKRVRSLTPLSATITDTPWEMGSFFGVHLFFVVSLPKLRKHCFDIECMRGSG